jgi:TET-Associated Glycosyltransferase
MKRSLKVPMRVYIPTYDRIDRQRTLKLLKPIQEYVWLVVQHREHRKYDYDKLLILPPKIKTISPTRQWILENSKSDKFIMMDDDLKIFRRINPTKPPLRKVNDQDVVDLYEWFNETLDKYFHASIANRYMNIHSDQVKECARACGILAYRKGILDLTKSRFDDVVFCEDHHMTLSLFEAGFPNLVNNTFAFAETPYTLGGCTHYRTNADEIKNFRLLHKLHPDTIRLNKCKLGSGSMIPRVNKSKYRPWSILYKKAYEMSKGKLI